LVLCYNVCLKICKSCPLWGQIAPEHLAFTRTLSFLPVVWQNALEGPDSFTYGTINSTRFIKCIYKIVQSGLSPIQGKSGNFVSNQGNSGGNEDILRKQGIYRVTCVSFYIGDFLYTQSHIQLSITIAKFPTFYSILLLTLKCAVLHFLEPKIWTAKNRVKALPNPTSVERNDKSIRENQGEMNSISWKVSVNFVLK